MAQPDYAALAQQNGGVSTPTGINFAQLAQQNGGAAAPAQPVMNPDGTINIPGANGGTQASAQPVQPAQPVMNADGTINIPQSMMGGGQSQPTGPTSNSTAANLGMGLWQSLAGTVGGMAKIGQNISSAASHIPILGKLFPNQSTTNPITQKLQDFSNSSTGAAQTTGKIAGDVAQFLAVPENDIEGAVSDTVDAGKFAAKFGAEAGDALTGILKFLGKSVVSAGTAAGVTAAQTGGNVKSTIEGGIAGLASPAVASGVEAAGEGIAKMFIPKSDAEAGMLQAYKASVPLLDRIKGVLGIGDSEAPSTAASSAFDKGLMGTESMLGVQAKRAQSKIWNDLVLPALKSSDVETDMSSFFDAAEKKITEETNDPTRLGVLKNALASIKEDFGDVGKVSMEQLQKYKEGWAEFVPEKAYKGQPIAGALNDVRNTLASMARSNIYEALGDNVKQAYLDYSNLYGITAMGRKAMTGAIKGGTGTTLKALIEMATVPIGTIGGQTIYKVGQLLDLVGPAGASVVRDVLGGNPSQNGNTSQDVNTGVDSSTQVQIPQMPQ